MAKNLSTDFEAGEVCRVIGITSINLNKLVERGSYGVAPSVRAGRGPGSRRRFSEDDIYGITLVTWMQAMGLRKKVIEDMLRVVSGSEKVSANEAARILRRKNVEYLIYQLKPEIHDTGKEPPPPPKMEVRLMTFGETHDGIPFDASTHIIAVARIFMGVGFRIKALRGVGGQ